MTLHKYVEIKDLADLFTRMPGIREGSYDLEFELRLHLMVGYLGER